jgi:hypothetical protein
MDRRSAIKWMLSAAATLSVADSFALGRAAGARPPSERGYGPDPDLTRDYHPGDVWPLTLTAAQRGTARALCDVIVPADERSPKASDLGIHDFLDEWISSPYPDQARDRKMLLEGLDWIDAEARRRHGAGFGALAVAQQQAICEAICDPEKAEAACRPWVPFFKRYRDLTIGGYCTTPEGMRDLGYIGNVPMGRYDGPPPEVLRRLGLE